MQKFNIFVKKDDLKAELTDPLPHNHDQLITVDILMNYLDKNQIC